MFKTDFLLNMPRTHQVLFLPGRGWIYCLKIRQNEIGDSAYYLTENKVEGGRLDPDIKVNIPMKWEGNQ